MKNGKNIKVLALSSFALLLLAGCGSDAIDSTSQASQTFFEESSSSVVVDELEGSGTKADPYLLDSSGDFLSLASLINAKVEQDNSYMYVELENDIDLAGVSFEGFGTEKNMFYGTFNGNKHTIKGLSITEYSKDKSFYGLFNCTYQSTIYDFNLEYSIVLPVVGVSASAYAGAVLGYGQDTCLYGISAKGDTVITTTSSKTQLFAGGIAGAIVSASGYYVFETNLAHYGNVLTDAGGETTGYGFAGGIAGYVYTNYDGVVAFMSSYNEGNVSTLDDAGGIVGRSDYYVSIQDCVATGEKVEALREEGSYAGGIAGVSGYDTLVARNYTSYINIKAANSTSVSYSSYAGAITGYYAVDDVSLSDASRYDNYLGTCNYENYYSSNTAISGDLEGISGTKVTDTSLNNLSLSSSWSLDSDKFVLSMDPKFDKNASVTLKANYVGGEDKTLRVASRDYDTESIAAILGMEYERSGYSFFDYFYDEGLTAQYRFYAPFIDEANLYAGFGDLSEILGTYQTSMSSNDTGYWYITEDNFYWINMYYETFTYSYRYYKGVIYLGEGGSYEGSLIFLESDGTLETVDINDSDYVYVGNKSATEYVLPNYTAASYLGTWYNASGSTFTLASDGNASGERIGYSGKTLTETGGFRANDNKLDIKISQVCYGEFVYNQENDLLIGDSTICARSAFTITKTYTYKSTDGNTTINIFVLSDDTQYTAVNKVLSSYTGTLSDGNEIIIDGNTYTVSGTTLSLKEDSGDKKQEGGDTPSSKVSDITGSWTTNNNITITFNSDLSGIYNDGSADYDFTYTIDYQTGTGTISDFGVFDGENTITVNDDGTLSVYLEDEYGDNIVHLSFSKKETSNALVGTWKNGSITLIINEDGTGTYDNGTPHSITVDFTTGKVTGAPFDKDTVFVSLNDDGTLNFTFEQDYEGP